MVLRIAQVSPYDFAHAGGVREHIRCLDRHLRALGHETWVLAPLSEGRDGHGDIRVVHVRGAIVPIHFSGSVARISVSPATYRHVKKLLLENAFDVIHVHEPLSPVLPLAVLRHSRSLNIGTFHAYRESHAGYQFGRPVLEPFFGRLSGRIAVSAAARDMVAHYFPSTYTIIPNGIEYERFGDRDVQPFEQYADGRPTVLFVGRLEERKGFQHLLRSFRSVAEAIPDARLLVVGAYDKDDKADHVRYARRHGLHGVRFVGHVPAEDIPRYYRSADVFCAPSTGFESFGIVLLEAMAAGTAIIASDIAGYRDVLTDGKEGRLVPPGDESALAEALVTLLRTPGERRRMSEQGRRTALGYSWDRVARRIADYYEEHLELRRSKAGESEREERSMREMIRNVSSWFDPR